MKLRADNYRVKSAQAKGERLPKGNTWTLQILKAASEKLPTATTLFLVEQVSRQSSPCCSCTWSWLSGELRLVLGVICTRPLKPSKSPVLLNKRLQCQGCARGRSQTSYTEEGWRCTAYCYKLSKSLLSDPLSGVSTGVGKIVHERMWCSWLGQELLSGDIFWTPVLLIIIKIGLHATKALQYNLSSLDLSIKPRDFYQYSSLSSSF